MAVKKSSKSSDASEARAPKRAGAGKSRGASAAVASETAAKSATPRAAKKSAGSKVAAPAAAPAKGAGGAKKAGEIKLNDRQRDFLKKIKEAAEPGYLVGEKIEQRTIEALVTRKLLKKGPKNKESGGFHYILTKAGEKHLTAGSAASSQS